MVQLTEYQWIQKCTRYRTIDKHDKRLVVTMIQKNSKRRNAQGNKAKERNMAHLSVAEAMGERAEDTYRPRCHVNLCMRTESRSLPIHRGNSLSI